MKLSEGTLQDKHIVLGISGSIAAYKSPELVRLLRCRGARVVCLLSENGARFVTPLTLETVSGTRVYQGMFDPFIPEIEHISLSEKADIVVIAPASADTLARLSAGRAEDFLSATVLATRAPVLVCPAMNDKMWMHPATQRHVRRLKEYGYRLAPPEKGELACGTVGLGRLASLDTICQTIQKILT